jgi:hypothetical protein
MKAKNESKKYFIQLYGLVIATIAITVALVGIIDPFYHYHKPWLGTDVYLYTYVYQTPGVARNLKYDSAIVGTSMSQNTRTSWFDEGFGWNTVKLSYAGATTEDYREILMKTYQSNNEIKHIIMDINEYQLTGNHVGAIVVRPEYLYNNTIWDDTHYLLNKNVVSAAFGRIIDAINGKSGNMAEAYTWGKPELFGKRQVLGEGELSRPQLVEENEEEIDFDAMNRMVWNNLSNFTPIIETHPETQFVIYYPPYSIVYWEHLMGERRLRYTLEVYAYSMEQLLQYDNVRVFYFQDAEGIIENLDNYRDATHHSPQINYYIYECIRNGVNEINLVDYRERIENMYSIVVEFDYDAIWK